MKNKKKPGANFSRRISPAAQFPPQVIRVGIACAGCGKGLDRCRCPHRAEQRIKDAAPDLLAACEAANVALRDLSGLATGDSAIWNKGGTGYEAFALVQAAIRKAEGGK